MARTFAHLAADWPVTRQLVLDHYGSTLGRAILARVERETERPRAYRPHGAGSVVLVIDKRRGYAAFRGRVLWRGLRYEVWTGVPRGAKSLKTPADDCRRDLNKKIRELEAGTAPARGKEKATLERWAVLWLEMKRVQGVRRTTLRNYELFMRLHILPALGHYRLAELTPELIVSLYASLEGKLSKTTIRALAKCLKTCLRDAEGYPVSATLFSKNTRAPRVPRTRQKFVATPQMLRQLLDATRGDREHALWQVAIWTGGRISEPLGLWWVDVELDTGAVVIRQRLSALSRATKDELDTPKTDEERVVYLPAEARAALRAHRERQEADAERLGWPESPYVFRSSKGKHLIQEMASYYWKRALKKANLPYFPIRQLRHSLATNLGLVGVPLEDVADILGHATVATTDQHYRQALPAKTVAAIESLAGLMGPPA